MSDRKRWTGHDEIIVAGALSSLGWQMPPEHDLVIQQLAGLLDAKPSSVHLKMRNMASERSDWTGAPMHSASRSRAVVALFEADEPSMQRVAHLLHAFKEGN